MQNNKFSNILWHERQIFIHKSKTSKCLQFHVQSIWRVVSWLWHRWLPNLHKVMMFCKIFHTKNVKLQTFIILLFVVWFSSNIYCSVCMPSLCSSNLTQNFPFKCIFDQFRRSKLHSAKKVSSPLTLYNSTCISSNLFIQKVTYIENSITCTIWAVSICNLLLFS